MKFTLPMCPTLNALYRYGRRGVYKILKARVWEDEVWCILGQLTDYAPIEGKVKLEMVMYLKRDRDIDSSLKLVLDVLEKGGVYENDKQVVDLHVIKAMDKKSPRLEITVEEL